MPLKQSGDIGKHLSKLKRFNQQWPRLVGGLAVSHFKQSFKDQGFTDVSLDKWEPRKRDNTSRRGRRSVLIKTGKLRRSVRIVRTGPGRVIVGTNLPYSQIHNEGGPVKATQKVPLHTRRRHSRTQRGRRVTVREHEVSAHSRQMDFTMPKRQFIGRSLRLNRKIQKGIVKQLSKVFS